MLRDTVVAETNVGIVNASKTLDHSVLNHFLEDRTRLSWPGVAEVMKYPETGSMLFWMREVTWTRLVSQVYQSEVTETLVIDNQYLK